MEEWVKDEFIWNLKKKKKLQELMKNVTKKVKQQPWRTEQDFEGNRDEIHSYC